MLEDKIKQLDIINNDVVLISNQKTQLKADYKKLKKPESFKSDYASLFTELNNQLDDATTHLVHRYEEFNDYKVNNDVLAEKNKKISVLNKKIIKLKTEIKNAQDKTQKIKLKNELRETKGQLSTTKNLYAKTMNNKKYIMISLAIMFVLILASMLTSFLYISPNIIDAEGGIAIIVITCICMVLMIIYFIYLITQDSKKWALDRDKPTLSVFLHSIWMFFLDAMGLGNFAVTTAVFKANGVFNDDKKIPGTLNVSRPIASYVGGTLVLLSIKLDIWTLVILLAAIVIGSLIGTKLLIRIKRKPLVLTMGIILAICSLLMLLSMKRVGIMPTGTKEGLLGEGDWYLMLIGTILFVGMGMLLAFGIGIYAPVMIVVVLLGMNFANAFPLMMLGVALSSQVNAYVGSRKNTHLPRTSWTIIFGSIIGVFLYYMIVWVGIVSVFGDDGYNYVKEALQWISIPVIAYAAYLLLKTFFILNKLPAVPKKVLNLETFDLANYKVVPKIDYEKENKKMNYTKVHWI